MEKVAIIYSHDIKGARLFSQFGEQTLGSYSLNKKNLEKLFSFTKIKDNPFSSILFFCSLDFYLNHKNTINEIPDKKGNHKLSLFIIFKTEDHKKISRINIKTFFTLVPDHQIHEIFHQISTEIIPKLERDDSQEEKEVDQKFSKKILEIATILGSEGNIEILMNKILTTCMEISNADAGSLAILGFDKQLQETEKDILTFYASKNNSKEINFNRFSMKIGLNSLAGYSIIRKKILNIPDAYKISKKELYQFNKSFDQQTGFRTKSILVVPMADSHGSIMGVIQLLNKKKEGYNKIINYDNFTSSEIGQFNYGNQQTVLSITNLAAILLKNQLLYNQVNDLLENFVKASVYAVEQRDPSTSGHSERVSTYSIELAQAASDSRGVLEDYHFNPEQIRELRYAALLHDFGKIAVREKTLIKSNKLEEYEVENIFKRIRIYLLNFQLAVEQQKINLLNNGKLSSSMVSMRIKKLDEKIRNETERMNRFRQIIADNNVPKVVEEEVSKALKEIRKVKFFDEGQEQRLLNESEFRFLNIKRGSLSNEERLEIETHVTQSFYFLQKINWISGLKSIPEIAYGHHEKLDGHGYPRGLKGYQILPQTKIMTVCDIYDALTASDRPYKKALSPEKSIKILYDEVSQNKIDKDLVDLFVKKKIYLVKPKSDDSSTIPVIRG